MKIILFIFVSLLSASTLHGQDRINTSIPVIGKDVLWSLDEATGWVKNIEGQWVEGKNKIQKKNVSVGNKELWDKAPFFEGIDNFIKFELREVVVGGDKFLLLTKKMNDGRWEYPITKAGWIPEVRVHYVVFKRNSSRVSVSAATPPLKTLNTSSYFSGSVLSTPDYLEQIALGISQIDAKYPHLRSSPGTVLDISVEYQELAENEICRFFIKNAGQISMTSTMYPQNALDSYSALPDDHYYECHKSKLKGLLSLISPVE